MDEDLKKCSKCENILLKSNFHKNKNMSDGLQPHCISCKKQYRKKYYIENRDLELECNKKYRSDNKNKINEFFNKRKKSNLNCK